MLGGNLSWRESALVAEIVRALEQGAQPADLRIFVNAPWVVGHMRDALAACVGSEVATVVEITTTRELALEMLAEPEASALIGRTFPEGKPRMLAAYEVDFVLEDLKTIGMRAKRLREVLKFLYRGWTELADESPAW
ncbi:MAG: hypothetical protein HUJ65_03070, partial [Oscillospiraceae bacterium]|nr:hypothetical protein [Oscillospiraceae bacterium]